MELYRVFFDLRVSEIFDIVVDYPDSEPALIDLKECMSEIDDSNTFLKTLQSR
jgi:anaphase-promoting complex subunit 2